MEKIFTNENELFTIVFSKDENEYPLYFKVYEGDSITDRNDIFADGFFRWDGCMEIDLHKHFCGWNRLLEFLMRDLYLQAATIIPKEYLENYGGLKELKEHYGII